MEKKAVCPSNFLDMLKCLDFSSLTVLGILSLGQFGEHKQRHTDSQEQMPFILSLRLGTNGVAGSLKGGNNSLFFLFLLLLIFIFSFSPFVFMVLPLSSSHLLQSFSNIFAIFFGC